jgi:hypothetical protein
LLAVLHHDDDEHDAARDDAAALRGLLRLVMGWREPSSDREHLRRRMPLPHADRGWNGRRLPAMDDAVCGHDDDHDNDHDDNDHEHHVDNLDHDMLPDYPAGPNVRPVDLLRRVVRSSDRPLRVRGSGPRGPVPHNCPVRQWRADVQLVYDHHDDDYHDYDASADDRGLLHLGLHRRPIRDQRLC